MDNSELKSLLNTREQELNFCIQRSKGFLASAPEGSLRISSCSSRNRQFYQYLGKDNSQVYIKDEALIASLAQKDYEELVLRSSSAQMRGLQRFVQCLEKEQPEDIYAALSEERKALVEPVFVSDQEFVRRWKDISWSGRGFDSNSPKYITDNKERVRSKSELLLANLLERRNIPYRYEFPLKLNGIGTIYPDFRVLNVRLRKEYIHEHFGMMDDPVYCDRVVSKIGFYISNGYFPGESLILTYETKNHPIDMEQLNMIIDKYYV